jgi:hypothetical protein
VCTGLRGVHLSKDITTIAGRALTTNLTLLGCVRGCHVCGLRTCLTCGMLDVVRAVRTCCPFESR